MSIDLERLNKALEKYPLFKVPFAKSQRIIQIISDLSRKPIASCRILDLACYDGTYSLEFALKGAEVFGIEGRAGNLKNGKLLKEELGLSNLNLIYDDVRNVSLLNYGEFDIILCSGILYHLQVPDSFRLLEEVFSMAKNLVLLDTHISRNPTLSTSFQGKTYWGHLIQEHQSSESNLEKEKKHRHSLDNNRSFWFSRPSLINFLSELGFSSVFECFIPSIVEGPHLEDRCTFVALKGTEEKPIVNLLPERNERNYPESSLSYSTIPEKRNYSNYFTNQLLKVLAEKVKDPAIDKTSIRPQSILS